MNCQAIQDRLLDFVDHDLDEVESSNVAAHLGECATCRQRHAELRDLVHGLSAARSLDRTQIMTQPPDAAPPTLGDFELLNELGRGGMGVVYRARQKSLNRVVALKILSRACAPSQRAIDRFAREAQAAARLHHTNIVPVYAQGEERGVFYYAMELIEGSSLDRVIREERNAAEVEYARGDGQRGGSAILARSAALIRSTMNMASRAGHASKARDDKRIARWIAGVAEGLHHAHEQGVVHRDIKPQNLLLGQDSELHITDFGLARLIDEPSMTLSSERVGTPAYMAPEQISPEGRRVDRRADIYSLGVTLYELLSLRRPFDAATYQELIHDVLNREPTPPRKLDPRVPIDLETICMRAMEKEPARRFSTAAEMARDLRRYADDVPIQSRRIGPLERAWRWVKRKPAQATAIATSLMFIALLPPMWLLVTSKGASQIQSGYEILLDNYRDREAALSQLGWMSWVGGESVKREIVRAFAEVLPNPKRSIEILAPLTRAQDADVDALYLLSWAYWRANDAAQSAECLERADRAGNTPSAAGYFFRGLALMRINPWEAERTFDEAIARRNNFVQAMLHQGRAMNQILYREREGAIGYYRKAVSRLEQVCAAQRREAYPRYVLTITYVCAAEIYSEMARGANDAAQRDRYFAAAELAYEKALDTAEEAIQVNPESPRGFAALAGYYESRGSFANEPEAFERAAETWERMDSESVSKSLNDITEQSEYMMRLLFWIDKEAGARTRLERLREIPLRDAGAKPADPAFYAALLTASHGSRKDVFDALRAGVSAAKSNAEALLLLNATARALHIQSPAPELDSLPTDLGSLSPGWTPEFLAQLAHRQHASMSAPASAPKTASESPELAARYFFDGLDALACGDRDAALVAFEKSWKCFDDEEYCFRAKAILFKMRRDPTWPRTAFADN